MIEPAKNTLQRLLFSKAVLSIPIIIIFISVVVCKINSIEHQYYTINQLLPYTPIQTKVINLNDLQYTYFDIIAKLNINLTRQNKKLKIKNNQQSLDSWLFWLHSLNKHNDILPKTAIQYLPLVVKEQQKKIGQYLMHYGDDNPDQWQWYNKALHIFARDKKDPQLLVALGHGLIDSKNNLTLLQQIKAPLILYHNNALCESYLLLTQLKQKYQFNKFSFKQYSEQDKELLRWAIRTADNINIRKICNHD